MTPTSGPQDRMYAGDPEIRGGQIWEQRSTGRQVEVVEKPTSGKVFVRAQRGSTNKLPNFLAGYRLIQDVATSCARCAHDPEHHWLATVGHRSPSSSRGCRVENCDCPLTRDMARA